MVRLCLSHDWQGLCPYGKDLSELLNSLFIHDSVLLAMIPLGHFSARNLTEFAQRSVFSQH